MPPPLLSATFNITIHTFRPLGGVFPITASMAPAPSNPPSITISEKNITVKGKCPVQLIFTLQNPPNEPGYVLLGVAFAANQADVTVGMHTFPTILIDRLPKSSSMTVTDQPQDVGKQHYGYVILIQSIATGEIGIIDPAMRNEPEN